MLAFFQWTSFWGGASFVGSISVGVFFPGDIFLERYSQGTFFGGLFSCPRHI